MSQIAGVLGSLSGPIYKAVSQLANQDNVLDSTPVSQSSTFKHAVRVNTLKINLKIQKKWPPSARNLEPLEIPHYWDYKDLRSGSGESYSDQVKRQITEVKDNGRRIQKLEIDWNELIDEIERPGAENATCTLLVEIDLNQVTNKTILKSQESSESYKSKYDLRDDIKTDLLGESNPKLEGFTEKLDFGEEGFPDHLHPDNINTGNIKEKFSYEIGGETRIPDKIRQVEIYEYNFDKESEEYIKNEDNTMYVRITNIGEESVIRSEPGLQNL